MSEYQHMPMPANTVLGVGVLVFLELHRRMFGNQFGTMPRPLRDDAFAQKGYCLDAPHEMPAGACFYDEFAEPDEDGPQWLVSQRVVERE